MNSLDEQSIKREQAIASLDHRIAGLHKLLATVIPDGHVTPSELALLREDIKGLEAEQAKFNHQVKSLELDAETNAKLHEVRRLVKRIIIRAERFFIRHA